MVLSLKDLDLPMLNTLQVPRWNIPAKVRRHLHVAVIRYMEQDCMCPYHVQCDIVPLSLTSEVVLPSYQHYLEREHHIKGARVNESETLNHYGKTILMLILARVNGYYSPYSAQSITEEEERCFLEMPLLMLRRNSSSTDSRASFTRLPKRKWIQL